ncbi:hypothetical protein BD560DRAFT_381726 [Blakeslea trispora]|nr:hypothetical protein BD560DRAFT_381726 [Blakeslea trispora]
MTVLNKDDNTSFHTVNNNKNHFTHPTANGRQDVLALKQQLADALGENGPLYWDALRDFVMGRLNRQEFDFYANLYLSRQHGNNIEMCLHVLYFYLFVSTNKLIFTMLLS